MISAEEATALVSKYLPDWGNMATSTTQLNNSILAQDLKADRAYPPYHRAMMDGITVNWQSFQQGKRQFKIEDRALAGQARKKLIDLQSCLEIMTGAVVPENCDLVIPYEQVEIAKDGAHVINDEQRPQWDNIHLTGSDCQAGDIVLPSGHPMNGPHWGIAASMGYGEIQTKRVPKILVISTGDELVDIDQLPLEHQIRRSNAYALKASLLQHSYSDVSLMHLKDDIKSVAHHYAEAAPYYDVMIYSGGVSKGKTDYLPAVWQEMGVTNYFHGITQRPGKPLWFGVDQQRHCAIFGMPGNPVSSLVCLHRYFLPKKVWYAKLANDFQFDKKLTYFMPVRLESRASGDLIAHPLKIKNSGEFTALAGSDGFLELPREQKFFSAGSAYRFYPWEHP